MKTNASPSGYRYCICLRSTIASPTFTPALNVRSTTEPDLTFRSFVRTKAPPLPGFTCWNSTTWNSVPSRSSVIPFLKSFVETLTPASRSFSKLDQFARGGSQDAAPVVRHFDHVLDAHAAEPRDVHAR